MVRVEKLPKAKELKVIDLYEWLKEYSYSSKYKNKTKTSKVHADDNSIWFGWTKRKKPVKLKRKIKVKSREFEALCRLLGAYISEGSVSTKQTTSKAGASIASSNKRWLEELQKDYHLLFSNVKTKIIRSTKKKRKLKYKTLNEVKEIEYYDNTYKLQMMNELTAVFFKELCGQKSKHKKIPEFMFHVPVKYKLILLEKMIEGDGSKATNKRLPYSKEYKKEFFVYDSTSLQLIGGLSLLLNQLKKKYTIRYNPKKKIYTISITKKGYNKTLKTRITEEEYEGYVYDLEVENNHMFVDSCGQILLHNTDSVFFKLGDKSIEDAKKLVEKINKKLPKGMELEFEGYYPRGLFVTKREGGAAKKKYALIREDGTVEIKGFELVRRDWSNIAKKTQEAVIKAVLEEGKPEKAVQIVKKTIEDLKNNKVPLKDLIILTQITRRIDKYEQQAPHVKAAKKLIQAGYKVKSGMVLEYIITKGRGSISDRAIPIQLLENQQPDPEYYIKNQVLPAALRILKELGITEKDLEFGGKQAGLTKWF